MKKQQEGKVNYPVSKFISWVFLAVSILILNYTYIRSNSYDSHSAVYYYKYYMASMLGIIFWGIVLRLRERIRANIVTAAVALVVGLYLIEGALIIWTYRGVDTNAAAIAAAAELGVEFDQRKKIQVIEDLIAEGVDAVPPIRPREMMKMDEKLLPLSGASGKTTVDGNETGRYMIYQSDRYGFNNPDSEWDADEIVWLLTGDSFTEGLMVQPGEDIAGQLRAITQESALSLGRSGNGPLIELAELKEYSEAIKPKRVLWIYFEGNDLSGDLNNEKNNSQLMSYIQDGFSQNLINRQKEIDSQLAKYISKEKEVHKKWRLHKWRVLGEIRKRISNINVTPFVQVVQVDPLFAKILSKAKARVEAWGGNLYFIYLPEYLRYKNKITSHDKYRKKSEVIDVVKGLDIPVIDIHREVFSEQNDPLSLFPYRLHGHYTPNGYSKIAKAIVENITLSSKSN